MAHGRPARPNQSEPGGRENGSDATASWAPVPKTFRAGDGSLPQPWEDIFGPLRRIVRRHVFRVFRDNFRIVPPALGEFVVVVGAALLAARSMTTRRRSR